MYHYSFLLIHYFISKKKNLNESNNSKLQWIEEFGGTKLSTAETNQSTKGTKGRALLKGYSSHVSRHVLKYNRLTFI